MNDLDLEIASKLAKDKEYGYEKCERIAFEIAFPKGFKVIKREQDNDYQGSTYIDLEADGKFYHCEYSWGSCGGCDTLEGNGEEAAIKMIFEEIKPVQKTKEADGQ